MFYDYAILRWIACILNNTGTTENPLNETLSHDTQNTAADLTGIIPQERNSGRNYRHPRTDTG